MSDEQPKALRLTADVRRQLLEQNDGFTTKTHYDDNNFSEDRTYTILDGELHIRSNSNTSWADSRRQSEYVADEAATHRYLRNNLFSLDQDVVVPRATQPKAKVTPVSDTSDSNARGGADTDPDPDDVDGETEDKSGLNTGLVIVITAVALTVTVAGVVVWKKTGKPALERRRAARAEQKAAEELAQIEDDESSEGVSGDED